MNGTPAVLRLQPPSVILEGAPGSGKTWSLATFVDAGVDVFVIGTEPNAADSLLDSVRARNGDVRKVHFHAVTPTPTGWEELEDVARSVQSMSFEQLAGMKSGIAKAKMTKWADLLRGCRDFTDDLDGDRSYGNVSTWGDDRALVIDSLSGLNTMARQTTVGLKPNMAQGEWGTAMELEASFLRKLTGDRGAFLVLVSHLDRNVDEATQAVKLMPAALGNKLAPQIMKDFSEIVYTKRLVDAKSGGVRYVWCTVDAMADLKARALPALAEMPPSFVPLVEAHRRRVAQTRSAAS